MARERNRLDIHNSQIPLICEPCEARHQGICGALKPDELLKLSRAASQRDIATGEAVLTAGETPERYANIMRGVVKLSRLMQDGRQQIVGLQFAPDFLGRPFSEQSEISAEAAGALRVCSFPRALLEEMARESPELLGRLHLQALRELDEAREWMMTLGRKTAKEKVASFILLLARNANPVSGASDVEIPLTRADIADFLGLTLETTSRQFSALRKAGLISLSGKRFLKVLNREGLQQASGESA